MAERYPVYELHIRPMFRLLEHEHMMTLVTPPIDLWDLDTVWNKRTDILERLKDVGAQNMPGERMGGPWPAEWIALFERWIATGSDEAPGHHLVLAKPDAAAYAVERASSTLRKLTAAVTAPTKGCRVWFEVDSVSSDRRDYTLYLEPAFPAQEADPTVLRVVDTFGKGEVTRLVIQDADGTQEVPVT
jgi:hypothetical protein